MIQFVSATRLARDAFWQASALGRSLMRLDAADAKRWSVRVEHERARGVSEDEIDPSGRERWVARLAFENARGLPELFNERIEAAARDDILVFVHDDVWLDDFFVCEHLEEALHEFAIVGVAGNSRRLARQPSWAFVPAAADFAWDDPQNLRGAVGHGAQPFGEVSRFGPTYEECELLDGVFIAARAATLADSGLRFDPRFRFHFYDLDFCRGARARGLRIGCWPIALTHQSLGGFDSESWREGYAAYLAKWKE